MLSSWLHSFGGTSGASCFSTVSPRGAVSLTPAGVSLPDAVSAQARETDEARHRAAMSDFDFSITVNDRSDSQGIAGNGRKVSIQVSGSRGFVYLIICVHS